MIGFDDQTNPVSRLLSAEPIPVRTTTSRYNSQPYQFLKRAFDIVFSLGALIVLSPIFLAVAIGVLITGGFPIVFRQARIGRNGRLFKICKFRTMVKNAEDVLRARPELWKEYQETYKLKEDPRISKLGHFLRSTTLDELPQLFNVLIGDMSIVGPRPIVQKEIEKFGASADIYLAMKPGCAGLWACSGRSDTTYEERVALETEYYNRASFGYDMKILFKTGLAVLTRRGAL
ncbi:MAG: sugar transferase [Fimbriimonadaceae bacterium]